VPDDRPRLHNDNSRLHNDNSFLKRRVELDFDVEVACSSLPSVADSVRVDRLHRAKDLRLAQSTLLTPPSRERENRHTRQLTQRG
jgi:hypothetical protein